MGKSKLFYPFGISNTRRFQMDDWLDINPESVHMEKWDNRESTNGEIKLQK